MGRLVPLKDYAGAVSAVSLLTRAGHDVHLVLIGDGPERERLAAEAQAAGIQQRVHLVGHQTDPLPWLRILDVYVNSSRTEAMNMGILEAMAAGLPVIATDVGDAAVMLGGTPPAGRIVPAREPAALAEAVGVLLADSSRRKDTPRTRGIDIAQAIRPRRWLSTMRSLPGVVRPGARQRPGSGERCHAVPGLRAMNLHTFAFLSAFLVLAGMTFRRSSWGIARVSPHILHHPGN